MNNTLKEEVISQNTLITVKNLIHNKKQVDYDRINAILNRTNYYTLMNEFINNPHVSTIEMVLSTEVNTALLYEDRDLIQEAVENPYHTRETISMVNGGHLVTAWIYDKYNFPPFIFSFEKLKPFSNCVPFVCAFVFFLWICFLVGSLWLMMAYNYAVIFIVLFVFSILCVTIPIGVYFKFKNSGYFHYPYYIDEEALSKLPIVEFVNA